VRLWAALAAVLSLSACSRDPRPPRPQAEAIRFETVAGQTPVQHGRRLARVLGCAGCHGAGLQGRPWDEEANFAISFSSNLTRALPLYSVAQFERAVREGVRPDGSPLWGMPSEIFTHLDAADMTALLAYLRTVRPAGNVHPRIVFGPGGRREIAAGSYKPAPQLAREGRGTRPAALDGRHEWARYMTRATCGECHGLTLTGHGVAPERTPDLIVAGAYTRAQFRHLMRTGLPPGGRRLRLMDEVARGRFAYLTDREVDAIHDYLVARARRAH
jgi:mono/diheme cytochrome c family protein